MRLLAMSFAVVLLASCSGNLRRSEGRTLDATDSRWLEHRLSVEIADRDAILRDRSWSSPQVLVRLDGEILVSSPLQAAVTESMLAHGAIVHADPSPGDAKLVITLTAMPGPADADTRTTSYLANAELRTADGVVLDIIRLQIDKRWKPQPKWK